MKAAKRPPILRTSAAALLALLVISPMPAKAVPANVLTWTGNTNNLWETNTNWNPNSTPFTDPTDVDLVFGNSKVTNTFNNAVGNSFIQNTTFAAGASKFVLTGTAVTMDGGGTLINNSTNLQVISFTNQPGFGGIQLNQFNFDSGVNIPFVHWTAAAGDILITNDVSFATQMTLILGGAHNITLTGTLFDTAAGSGQLVKEGTGTVVLTGNSTFRGNTTVNGGLLQVDGSIASLKTFVNPGGTLGGRGFIGGNVYNSGNVAPGDSPGTLTVRGNYLQTSAGTLTIQVAGSKSGQYDQLAVQKQAGLDGTLRIDNMGKCGVLKVGQKINIVTADGGVVGKFSKVSYAQDTIVSTKVVYKSNSVVLEGASGYFEQFARNQNLTPNEIAVSQGLDKVAFHNEQPKLISFLNCEPVSNIPGDLDRISPEALTSIFTLGTALANVQTANLQRRTEDIRYGSHGFSASGFAAAGSGPLYSGGVAGPNGNDGKESKEMKNVVPPEDRWGVFITGVGEWVNVSGDGNARGYDLSTGGFTVGADYKVTPNFAVGISAGYAGTGSDLNDGGRVFVNGGKLGLYATYFTGGFYVDTAVNGGYNSYDTRRAGLEGTARGDTDGGELNVLFGTGYDWKLGNFTVGPTASFQYTYLGIGDFTEHGSLAPLSFRSQHQDSLRTALGMKASYDWKLGGVVIRPEVRASWQHEYGDTAYQLDASFDNSGSSLFSVNGPELGRDSLLLGAGFAIIWNERTSTYVYYDGELARTNYNAQNVSAGVRLSF